jgi:hypothetical protein
MKTGRQIPVGPPAPAGTMVDQMKTIAVPLQKIEVMAGEINEIPFHLEP